MSVFMLSRPGASAVAGLGLAPQVQAERRYRTENKKLKTTPPWDPRSVLLFAAGLAAGYTVHGAADIRL